LKVSRFNTLVTDDYATYLFDSYRRGLHQVEPTVVRALETLKTEAAGRKHGRQN